VTAANALDATNTNMDNFILKSTLKYSLTCAGH
jgi:hypothetical protein